MKQDFVHQLVQTLTKSEKRYFKLFSQVQPGTKNYLQLFDAMEGMKEYDAKLIKKRLGNDKMNISYEKNYLGKMLMKSLRLFYDENSPNFYINNILLDVEILENKRFFAQAIKLLDEAIALAANNFRPNYLPILYYRKANIMRVSHFQGITGGEVVKWEKDYKEAIALNDLVTEFELIYVKIQQKIDKASLDENDRTELKEIMNTPLMKRSPESMPFYAHISYLIIKTTYLHAIGENYDQELFEQAALWQKEKSAQLSRPMSYIASLRNAAYSYARRGEVAEIEKLIAAMKEATVNTPREALHKQFSLVNLQFVLLGTKCMPGEATEWLNKNINEVEMLINKSTVYEKYLVLYQTGYYYLADGNAYKALDYFLRVNPAGEAEQYLFYPYSLALTLACHYELGNYALIPHLARSMKRTLMRIDKFSDLEKTILAGFNKIAIAKKGKEQQDGFQYFLKKMKAVQFDKNEYSLEFELITNAWLRSRIEKQPMIIYLKSQYNLSP